MLKESVLFPLVFFLLFFQSSILAQEKITDNLFLDAEFRPRLEFDNRDFKATGFDFYATYRTRIGIKFKNIIERTTLYFQIADSRLMGFSDPYLTGKNIGPNKWDNNLGVTKVFIEIHDLFKKGTLFKIGRMSNEQGRNRIFGPGNWNIFGPRTYDGLKIGYSTNNISWHVWNFWGIAGDRHWYFMTNTTGNYPDQNIHFKADHTLTGLDLSAANNVVNLLAFLDLDQLPVADTLHNQTNISFCRITLAANLKWRQNKNTGLWIDFDGSYQFGQQAHSKGSGDISSFLLAGDFSYHFNFKNQLWFGMGFDFTSGDDGKSLERVTNFYEYYYSKHSFQGNMDFFTNVSGIKSFGLKDYILRTGVNLIENVRLRLNLHHFCTEKPFMVSGATDLGNELDITLDFSIRKGIITQLGFDLFWPENKWQGEKSSVATFGFCALTASF